MGLSREKFAAYYFGMILVGFCFGGVLGLLSPDQEFTDVFLIIFSLAALIFNFWAAGERLKNLQQSPLLALVLVIPLINLGFLLYLLLTPEPKPTAYPKDGTEQIDTTSNFCPKCGTRTMVKKKLSNKNIFN